MLPQCRIKELKPPKFPKSGKKLYLHFFLRELKNVTHIYWLHDGLYIVSVPKPLDARKWLDNNIDRVYSRKWRTEDIYPRRERTLI